jgi:hypothetical protein
MPFTTADLASVDAAIASGELSVEVAGKRVTYRQMHELEKARQMIASDIAAQSAQVQHGAAYRVTFATHRE